MIPQLQDIFIDTPQTISIVYDRNLRTEQEPPTVAFGVNYGEIPIEGVAFEGGNKVVLTIDNRFSFSYGQVVTLTYTIPSNTKIAIQGAASSGLKNGQRVLAKSFSQVPVKNRLNRSEESWKESSNLAAGGYPRDERSDPTTATPADFIVAYGERETVQLTNLESPRATTVNYSKLNMAIQDACALIDNYVVQASRAGKLLISSSRRRTALIIARYYLDSVRKRKEVIEDYERAIKELDKARDSTTAVRPHDPWWLDDDESGRRGIRAHRIPQVYNRQTGLGLEGFKIP